MLQVTTVCLAHPCSWIPVQTPFLRNQIWSQWIILFYFFSFGNKHDTNKWFPLILCLCLFLTAYCEQVILYLFSNWFQVYERWSAGTSMFTFVTAVLFNHAVNDFYFQFMAYHTCIATQPCFRLYKMFSKSCPIGIEYVKICTGAPLLTYCLAAMGSWYHSGVMMYIPNIIFWFLSTYFVMMPLKFQMTSDI
jgi:hypothetical protein